MSDENKDLNQNSTDEEILATAKKRYQIANDYWAKIYRISKEDDLFVLGEQWNPIELQARKKAGRPAVVVNKSSTFVHNVVNEMRQNRPALKYRPGSHDASKETAKIFQGIARAIEYKSNAQVAYNSAGDGAVRRSFGWMRVTTDYVSADSFDQEIKILSIENQYAVKMDPLALKFPDGSASRYGFVEDTMSLEEFKEAYPDAKDSLGFDWSKDSKDGWYEKDRARICEYYYTDFKKIKLYRYQDVDGKVKTGEKSDIPEGAKIFGEPRDSVKPVIKWCKITGCEILERTEWPSSYIPIVPVYGARVNIDGEWHLESLIRHSKDSQRIYNFNKSNEVEAIGLTPKAPWIAAEGQIDPTVDPNWRTANKDNHAYLTYKPVSLNGVPVPPPQRNVQEPAIQAVTHAALLASDDIKATTGIFDDSLGRNTQSKSGIALQRTQQQSATSNYHFIDNQAISIQHVGRILAELIPVIYDTPRIVSIIGDDGTHDFVRVNQEFQQGDQTISHMLAEGSYDVYVDVGPSYQTRRQEAADTIQDLIKTLPPEAVAAVLDLLVKNLDIPDADELSARLKKMAPPGIIEDKNQPPIPPQAQQQIQQLSQLVEQLTQTANQQHQIIQTKSNELESKERIEMAKLQNQASIELAKIESKEALTVLGHAVAQLNERLNQLDFNQPFDQEDSENNLNQPGNNAAAEQGQM